MKKIETPEVEVVKFETERVTVEEFNSGDTGEWT